MAVNQDSELGALPPPPGVIPDFIHPHSLAKYNVLCQALCLSMSTFFVWMRMYTRSRITRNLGAEDYTCCIAWLGLIVYGTISLELDKYGGGVHGWNVTKQDYKSWARLVNVEEIIYGPLILIIKISILLLYSRIFAPHRKSKTYFFIHLVLWFNVLFYVPITIVKIFLCTPRTRIWDKAVPGHCINLEALLYTTGIVNLCSDISILILPIGSIWQLQMDTKRKLGISAAFMTGLFAPIASGVRLAETVTGGGHPDATYYLFQVQLWTEAEITTGIICSCLPTLPALFRHYGAKRQSKASGHEVGHSAGNSAGRLTKSSFLSTRRSHPTSKYLGPDDSQLLHAEYLELGEGNNQRTVASGLSSGPTTIIRGGVSSGDLENNATANHRNHNSFEFPENANATVRPGTGILKTVCVETHPQPAAQVLHGASTEKQF